MGMTLHQGKSFLVCDDLGDIRPGSDQGYYHLDTRFLSRHLLRLDGVAPVLLGTATPGAAEGWHVLTNPELRHAPRATLAIEVHRALADGVREEISVENFGDGAAELQLGVGLDADFAYILTVKKEANGGRRDGWSPRVDTARRDGGREISFDLADGATPHATRVDLDRAPDGGHGGDLRFDLRLDRRERWTLTVRLATAIAAREQRGGGGEVARGRGRARRRHVAGVPPRLETDCAVLREAFARAVDDLAALRIKAEADGGGGGECAIAAGIPWYMDLFGRDSLIASYQSIFVDPELARGTLGALARLQGKKVDRLTEEAPGKILHEYRRGPLTPAARKLIPAYPYYGSIDATPLFLVVLSELVRWTGDLEPARDLWDAVRSALEWMRRDGDRDGDGFLEYQRDSDVGLENQGWKDSDDSVRFRDGRIAEPPIALVEVQGYAYDARRRVADLARRVGDGGEARRLEGEAVALRRGIAERYWVAEREFPPEALDGHKRPVDALTSNPAHLLWAGAVDAERARRIADVLLGDELFSGYGIRTMGDREGGYNPVSYHDGSVWPHDNALALMGLVRYRLHDRAARLASGLLAALAGFQDRRPPELFCGFPSARFGVPVPYPTACRPQAWASGSVLLLVRALLGLEVDAPARRIALAPTAVEGLTRLDLSGIPLAGERIDVSMRVDGGRARAEVRGLPRGWERVESLDEGK